MIFEMRTYHCIPGRLPDVLKRFETATLSFFEKHGIRQAGFWTTVIGPSSQDLIYLLAWESLAEREQKWGAFMSDPGWIEARARSEHSGPVVASVENRFLQPTAFSAVK